MKRTGIKRGTSQMKRSPMNKVSPRRKREKPIYLKEKKAAFAALATAQLREEERPICEVCYPYGEHRLLAQDWHHWWPVGRGGPYLGGKMFCVCRPCHDWIHHQDPEQAQKDGWLK